MLRKVRMSERKNSVGRPYPPDFVSAETLAYRLDCSRSTIDAYVRAGLLPKPEIIGNLQRWDFSQVRAFIKASNSVRLFADPQNDAYSEGIDRAETAKS